MFRLVWAALLCGGLASAQPVVSAVLNNYSYVPASLPHHGIAQGSIFVIFGTGLSNSSTGLQSVPLRTTLEGVSAAVTVGGVTRAAILYYVTPTQVAGILPSNTPVGAGTITVTNNGRTSATAPIRVVQSAFGALTLDGSGTGAAAVFDAANQLLGPSNATHPGDVIVLYGTGAGPSAGDETVAQTQTNLANVPILVEIGGKPATVLYHGRTVFPGLDQINVALPPDTPTGCAVPVAVSSGIYISNFSTIPVSASGPHCPALEGGDPGTTATEMEMRRWITAGQFVTGSFGLQRQRLYSLSQGADGITTRTVATRDLATGGFLRLRGDLERLFLSTSYFVPVVGSCMVSIVPSSPLAKVLALPLDAGGSVSVTGPSGSRTIPRLTAPVGLVSYSAEVGDGRPANFLDAGEYTISVQGGQDIGTFSGSILLAPELEWTNRAELDVIQRTTGVTVTWSGGDPTGFVTIQGQSFVTNGTQLTGTTFQCVARNSDRRFTIPATVLLTLPVSETLEVTPGVFRLQRGALAVASLGTPVRVHATGLDLGSFGSQMTVVQSTQWR